MYNNTHVLNSTSHISGNLLGDSDVRFYRRACNRYVTAVDSIRHLQDSRLNSNVAGHVNPVHHLSGNL